MRKKTLAKKQKDIVVINGQEYDFDKLDDTQKYLVATLSELEIKIRGTTKKLDIFKAARGAFTQMLLPSLKESDDDTNQDNT